MHMKKPLLHHLQDYFFPHPRNDHRPHVFSAVSVAALLLAVVLLEGAYLLQTRFVFIKTDFLASVLPGVLVTLTNEERAAKGVPGVIEDAILNAAAQAAAEDMAANGYFAHISPDGKDPWYWLDQAGYRYSYAGQNLAVNFVDSENVQSAWMESPTHRANILKPEYTYVGFGTANGMYEGQMTTFVVEFFAAPARAEAAPAIAVAEPALTPTKPAPASTTAVLVLGDQVESTDVAATAPVSLSTNWFSSLSTAPFQTSTVVLTALLALIGFLLGIAVFMRGKFQHPSVVMGGALLVFFISGALIMSAVLVGSPIISTSDGQPASAFVALQ